MPRLNNAPPPAPTAIGRVSLEDGIMHHQVNADTVVTEGLARRAVEQLSMFASGLEVPAVVDIRGVRFADRAARDVFAEDLDFEIATAIVVESSLSRNLGNLYLRVSRPTRPTRLFGSLEEATQWASEFVS